MVRDQLIRSALEHTNWDLLACSTPSNVLLLTGYWPAAGNTLAVATRSGEIILIVPEDEDEVAEQSWADEVETYTPVPMDRLVTQDAPIFEALAKAKERLGVTADRIGLEQAESLDAAGYAPNLFRGSAARLLRRAFPGATLAPADELLAEIRSVKTPAEIEHIRTACRIAGQAFSAGVRMLKPGVTEAEAAAAFRVGLSSCIAGSDRVKRCDGFTYCMSGPNSTRASGPYSRSRARRLEKGDLVILRCNSHADGYWTDITRTYQLGQPDSTKEKLFDAVFAARDAVLRAIRPGISGGELDRVARSTFESLGFGDFIRHPTGHGVGFGMLDHTARPRLHPKSDDVLQPGMTLKLEPGLYVEGHGGIRNSDMVAVNEAGVDVLTPFHWSLRDVILQ